MNADDFLNSRSMEFIYGKYPCHGVLLKDAQEALKMAREEAFRQATEESVKPMPSRMPDIYGWVCPICGSVYSPDTKECISCRNNRAANANCIINTVNYSEVNKATAPLGELTKMVETQQSINNEMQQ